MKACVSTGRCVKHMKNGEKQKINADKAGKKMKVVKELTLVSLIDEVSEFFPKSSKQDGDINKKI